MSQSYKIVTTNAGRNAVLLALSQDKTVTLTHMAVGDGGGKDMEPLSSMTALVHETFRAQINEISFDAAKPDLFTAELFIPQSVGGFYIREIGLFMEDGTLFAVGSTPLTEKPDLSSGSASDLLIKILVRVLDAATISLSIDPAQVLATRDYVDRMDKTRIKAAVEAHNKDSAAHDSLARKEVKIVAGTGLSGGGNLEADRTVAVKYGAMAGTACQGNDPRLTDARTPASHATSHSTGGADALKASDIGALDATHANQTASTTVSGHTKLNNTVTSTSSTEAATANAVKQAYDKAASMTVPLNNTVTSTSTTEAATANAVKTAYDRAASADSTANSAYSTANSAYSMAASGAPRPQSYSGKGQWVNVSSSTAYVTLPSGGTWAYHLSNVNASGGAYYSNVSGVASGGSQINTMGAGHGLGLAWRIS